MAHGQLHHLGAIRIPVEVPFLIAQHLAQSVEVSHNMVCCIKGKINSLCLKAVKTWGVARLLFPPDGNVAGQVWLGKEIPSLFEYDHVSIFHKRRSRQPPHRSQGTVSGAAVSV